MEFLKTHEEATYEFVECFSAEDRKTDSGINHRVLVDQEDIQSFVDFITPIVKEHQISKNDFDNRKKLIEKLKIQKLESTVPSPYPQNTSTQKGNFAEIFLAEYLEETTDTSLPIYRLRYNPNVEQSMKGDDVLMFDLDAEPVRIIVGESKFRTTPQKKDVIDITDGLIRANKAKVPISLMFVAYILRKENKEELAQKVEECTVLFALNKVEVDYVGMLMSSRNAKNTIDRHTTSELRNMLMISVGMLSPQELVASVYQSLEDEYDCFN